MRVESETANCNLKMIVLQKALRNFGVISKPNLLMTKKILLFLCRQELPPMFLQNTKGLVNDTFHLYTRYPRASSETKMC